MQVRFLQNLGSEDCRKIKDACGVSLNYKTCMTDAIVDLPEAAAEWLGKKYKALFEPASIRGNAKQSQVTAPAK